MNVPGLVMVVLLAGAPAAKPQRFVPAQALTSLECVEAWEQLCAPPQTPEGRPIGPDFAVEAERVVASVGPDLTVELRMLKADGPACWSPKALPAETLRLAQSPCLALKIFPVDATLGLFKRPRLRLVK